MKSILIALLALCICACETIKPPLKNANKEQLKLAADAHQVLQKHCQQCHGKGDSRSDEMLLEYEALIEDKFLCNDRPEIPLRCRLEIKSLNCWLLRSDHF